MDSPLLRRMELKKDDGDEVSLTAGALIRSGIKEYWTWSPAVKDESIRFGD